MGLGPTFRFFSYSVNEGEILLDLFFSMGLIVNGNGAIGSVVDHS